MNPILLKSLISLAAANKKPDPAGMVGHDAHLKNRIVLFSDETVTLPDWGISGLPAMVLGAAPQTCLFVSDLVVNPPSQGTGENAADGTAHPPDQSQGQEKTDPRPDNDAKDATTGETVSFSLTISSPPAPDSTLTSRTIVWKLALPIASYRDVQTSANSSPVHAPVIASHIILGGIERDVEIGLLEMGGLEQPLLIGKDTLADKFLIRPDRPKNQTIIAAPTVDLTPKPSLAGSSPDHPDNGKTAQVTQPVSPQTNSTMTQGDTTPTPEPSPDASAESHATNNETVNTSETTAQKEQDNSTADAPEQQISEPPIQPDNATAPNTPTVANQADDVNNANGVNSTEGPTQPASDNTAQDTTPITATNNASSSTSTPNPPPQPTTPTVPAENQTEPT